MSFLNRILGYLATRTFVIYGCESRGDAHIPYMTRYTIFTSAWFSIKIHVFHRSDHDVFHSHPWWFWSLILSGGYYEDTPKGSCWYSPGRLLWRPVSTIHCVRLKNNRPCVTMVVTGPKNRPWFFHPHGEPPVPWREYFKRLGC